MWDRSLSLEAVLVGRAGDATADVKQPGKFTRDVNKRRLYMCTRERERTG